MYLRYASSRSKDLALAAISKTTATMMSNIAQSSTPTTTQLIDIPHRIRPKLPTTIRLPGTRNRRQMHHGINPTIRHINLHHRLQHRAHILEINLNESVRSTQTGLAILTGANRATGVDRDDFPALVGEVADCAATELAGAAGDDDAGFAVAAGEFTEAEGVGAGGEGGAGCCC